LIDGDVTIVVPIERTPKDYREAHAWMRWHSWVWPVLAGLAVLASLLQLRTHRIDSLPFILILDALAVSLYFFGLFNIAGRMLKAHKKNGITSYSFTKQGFECHSEASTSQSLWSVLSRVSETRRSFLLEYPNGYFLILPKHCVPAEQLVALRELLRNSLGARARLA
jgi:hypothetical protein